MLSEVPRISNIGSSVSENFSSRNCPKSLGRPYNVALRDTEMALFGPFWRSYTGQIYGRNSAPTPFQTVSLGNNRVNKEPEKGSEGGLASVLVERGVYLLSQ